MTWALFVLAALYLVLAGFLARRSLDLWLMSYSFGLLLASIAIYYSLESVV